MSNILFDKLPSAVLIAGREFSIDTSFRIMAKFENELLKTDMTQKDKRTQIYLQALMSFYKNNVPNDIEEAVNKMWWFYRCGEDITSRKNQSGSTKNNVRLYDYEVDGSYIISAFRSQYNIDLTVTDLHWWLFRGYFSDLSADTDMVKIMTYRAVDLKEISNRKERERYRKLKERYKLPEIKRVPMTKEERDKAFKARMLK